MNAFSPSERRAVIDVGSNSVKLLVADMGARLMPVLKLSRPTSLGRGVFRRGRLQHQAIARTVSVVAEFVARAAELHPASLQIIATSAAREAANGQDLVEAIFRATQLTVELISGDQEADFLFHGVMNQPELRTRPLLIMGVGGGSTQWVVAEGGVARLGFSARLGTRRLWEDCAPGDPPTRGDLVRLRQVVTDCLRREVRPRILPRLTSPSRQKFCLVGSGGGLNALAKLAAVELPGVGELARLSAGQIRQQIDRLQGLSAQERRQLPGLNPEKAESVFASAIIYEAVMVEFNFAELSLSRHGLRSGVLVVPQTRVGEPRSWVAGSGPVPCLPGTRPPPSPAARGIATDGAPTPLGLNPTVCLPGSRRINPP